MDILKFYKALLHSLNVEIADESYCKYVGSGLDMPLMVDDKRLVLPTRDILRQGIWDQRIAFHPLSENPNRTESSVIKRLKSLVQIRLSASAIDLMRQLIAIAVDTDRHSTLSPKAQRLLVALSDADEKFLENFDKIIRAMSPDDGSGQHFVSVYLKKGGLYKDRTVAQLGVVSFPLAHAVASGDGTVCGVKVRRKDERLLTQLLEFVFPNLHDISEYAGASDSMMAPRFDALLKAYANVATAINRHVKTFRKYLEDDDRVEIDLDWQSMAEDLTAYRGQIPSLAGNEGDVAERGDSAQRGVAVVESGVPAPRAPAQHNDDDTPPWQEPKLKSESPFNTERVKAALSASTRPAPLPPAPPTYAAPTPAPAPASGKVDFNEMMARRHQLNPGAMPPPPQQQPYWNQQPVQPQVAPGDYVHRPNMRSQQMVYPQPMPMQPVGYPMQQPMGYPMQQPMGYPQPMAYPQPGYGVV